MKDKLEKNGHKRSYYMKRLALKTSLLGLAFFAICAIPVGLSYRIAEITHAAKERKPEENSSQVADTDNQTDSQEVKSFEK